MTAPIRVSRRLVEKKPYLVWNAFVDLIAGSSYSHLSKKQRPAYLVFRYESEVHNGGHMQYFENFGTKRIEDTVAALELLGAPCHAKVLARAAARFNSQIRKRIRSVEEYVETALEGEFDLFDRKWGKCRPELEKVLKDYLSANQAEFVLVGGRSDRKFVERQTAMDRIGRSILRRMEKEKRGAGNGRGSRALKGRAR